MFSTSRTRHCLAILFEEIYKLALAAPSLLEEATMAVFCVNTLALYRQQSTKDFNRIVPTRFTFFFVITSDFVK